MALPAPVPHAKYVTLNNLAWVDLMLGGAELLEEADRYSKEAFRQLPKMSAVAGTRGFVLIRKGETRAGMDLVLRSYRDNSDDKSRATNACCLAIGSSVMGNSAEARRHLENARKRDPACLLLTQAEGELRSREEGAASSRAAVATVTPTS